MADRIQFGTMETMDAERAAVEPGDDEAFQSPHLPSSNPLHPITVLRWLTAVFAASLLISSVAWLHQSVPAYLVARGPVIDVTSATSGAVVDTGLSDNPRGRFLALTVQMSPARRWETLVASWRGTEVVKPVAQASTFVSRSNEMMVSSAVAAVAASQVLGVAAVEPTGVEVVWVHPNSLWAEAGLQAGDVVTAFSAPGISRRPVAAASELVALVESSPRDIPVSVIVARNSQIQELTLPTAVSGRGGIIVQDAYDWVVSAIDVDMGEVTGSSAGLMLTLALIDAASPGDLTAGRLVAGTGVVTVDGRVSAVSGLNTKVKAAAVAGADIVFFPGDMTVNDVPSGVQAVPVSTVREALQWLCIHGSDDQVCDQSRFRPGG